MSTIGPAGRLADASSPFLVAVAAEVVRARAKFPGANATMVALMEEVGELAKAMLDETPERIYAEAVQVACMAMRAAEEGDATLTDYRIQRAAALDARMEEIGCSIESRAFSAATAGSTTSTEAPSAGDACSAASEADPLSAIVAEVVRRKRMDGWATSIMDALEQVAREVAEKVWALGEEERKRLRQERFDALTVYTKEGLLASEWVARTGKAERERDAADARAESAERERDGLRDLIATMDAALRREMEIVAFRPAGQGDGKGT